MSRLCKTKAERKLLFTLVGFLILFAGVLSNVTIVTDNECRMPVLSEYYFKTSEHIAFNFNNPPHLWILADIITIKNYVISIGDILIWIGSIMSLVGVFNYGYYKLCREKNETCKNSNKEKN